MVRQGKLTCRERPVAPLLRVVRVDDARDERFLAGGSSRLVGAELGAGGVEIASFGAVGRVGPPAGVLRAETRVAVVVAAWAER